MAQRIICNYAFSPIIFVAPHGYPGDDYNTDYIALKAAEHISASFLINQGWRRNTHVDESQDFADCNHVDHVSQPIIKDEFLDPYIRGCIRAKRNFSSCLAVFIHGVSDLVRKTSGVPDLDIILGYGLGKENSTTVPEIVKNKFIHCLYKDDVKCCVGKSGGQYSGFSKNNMNQYWRKHHKDMHMMSMQLEIVRELREDKIMADLIASTIADAVNEAFFCTSFQLPTNFKYESV
jgi:hypothetical protein